MPPVKQAWCCQRVCGFRYADDMRQLAPRASVVSSSAAGTRSRSCNELMTGDAVDQGVGGRETRRDLVVAGLAQHDPGDRRPLAIDPADGPEGEAAAGRVV